MLEVNKDVFHNAWPKGSFVVLCLDYAGVNTIQYDGMSYTLKKGMHSNQFIPNTRKAEVGG